MTPDIEKYRDYVDRFDLTENQKVELIHTLWRVMESFVDRAFETDPAQLAGSNGRRGFAAESPKLIDLKPSPLRGAFKHARPPMAQTPDNRN